MSETPSDEANINEVPSNQTYPIYIIGSLHTYMDIGPAVIAARDEDSIPSVLERELSSMPPCRNGKIFSIEGRVTKTDFQSDKEGLILAKTQAFWGKYQA